MSVSQTLIRRKEAPRDDTVFSTVEVSRITGASYRQLDFWVRQGYLSRRLLGDGSGSRRWWTWDDIGDAQRLKAASDARRTPLRDLARR